MHQELQFAERIENKKHADTVSLNEMRDTANQCVVEELDACASYTQMTLDQHNTLKEDVDSFLQEGLQRVVPTGKIPFYVYKCENGLQRYTME